MISNMIGALNCLVIDCPEPRLLATFYDSLLGLDRAEDSEEWVTLGTAGAPPRIAFQKVVAFVAPTWGTPNVPQQMHMDVLVRDLDVAQAAVLRLGATLLDGSDKPIGYRVFADPVGHPFCVVTPEGLT
jgi:predicted enzyme related to lactoylglutathione lyase